MNNKGFSTLVGLCYVIPMIFIATTFFLLSTNEQKTELLSTNGVNAQYIAESALAKTFDLLCADVSLYDDIRQKASSGFITYEKELLTESRQENGQQVKANVYLHFFNYRDSCFTLTAVGKFANASKRVTVYIKENEHKFSILWWDYHEQKL
ncbi:hypothetical protein [Pectinatus cerevisiiphilus]|uniref:Flp pilus-assembly TadE/G-like protein n=1 Tax=Pectinatus cerevisiiphilus TaxID=86956 RepID=A0A4R3K8T1_9FIRM|nr:hypothetical protein [Pectinatus cerevisiiphilus]TCS79340.1 hypothetical protein EDC37_107107 [Pectinatus cerevisiiphilus]